VRQVWGSWHAELTRMLSGECPVGMVAAPPMVHPLPTVDRDREQWKAADSIGSATQVVSGAQALWWLNVRDFAVGVKLKALVRRRLVWFAGLPRYPKRTILATTDFLLLGFALWLALSLRLGALYVPSSWPVFWVLLAAPVIGVATFFQLGLYRLVTRFIGSQGAVLIPIAVGLSGLLWALLVLLSGIQTSDVQIVAERNAGVRIVPRSVIIFYPVLGAIFIWGTRQVAGWMLRTVGIELPVRLREKVSNVLIYGAGRTGAQLLDALRRSGSRVVGFVDQDSTLWRQYVAGVKVHGPHRLARLVERHDVSEVLLAMPSAKRRERRAALQQLEPLTVKVRALPTIEELAAGKVTVSDLRPVEAEDLLGREPTPADAELLARNVAGKSVLVTGAGGSIGSERVRQVLRQGPRRLVLLEASESQLYQIEHEVRELLRAKRAPAKSPKPTAPDIVAILGSIQNSALARRIMQMNAVETIYHAAAYKHVSIVEQNAVAGLRNNTFGTAVLAEAAASCGVERFVLVSTDKAVRPTSIMGASKRLAEMMLQARANGGASGTVFTIVRFGNVLDSSGSVVRRFRQQIEAGGPVTVTDPRAIRYFMSIPEAAALVIQAGAMASGGEVFVLDMDQPVKIDDLAKSMIHLMGREVRDEKHPDGDIAIEYIGLRDGEKLHEELMLGDNVSLTQHPRILKSHEPYMPRGELTSALDALRAAMEADDLKAIHAVLTRTVEGYRHEIQQPLPPQLTLNGSATKLAGRSAS
jgi:UDP-N-acetylglucosamine 4,6-dehydratase